MVGRSNVGKSSLINALIGRKGLARVSQTPGKTQAIYFYLVNDRFYLVDLPGYGYAKVSRSVSAAWGDLVRGYLEGSQHLRTLFLLLDSRREPSEQDLQILEWMAWGERPWRGVMTKVDKLSNNELGRARRSIATTIGVPEGELIGFSKVSRRGVPEIWSAIEASLAGRSRSEQPAPGE